MNRNSIGAALPLLQIANLTADVRVCVPPEERVKVATLII